MPQATQQQTAAQDSSRTDAAQETHAQSDDDRTTADAAEAETTTVEVRCTGHVYTAIGKHGFEYEFRGTTLRDFLEAFFEEYDIADMLIAETEADATANGWAPTPDPLPGTWRKNPEGEQTRTYARILINGRFNEHQGGFDAPLNDGDRVALVYPFIFCC